MTHDWFGKEEPWVKHLSSTKEYELSNCPDLVAAEDLITAGHTGWFDEAQSTWAFEVITSSGFPRKILGVLVIRADLAGKLFTSVEE